VRFSRAQLVVAGKAIDAAVKFADGRADIQLASDLVLTTGQTLEITLS